MSQPIDSKLFIELSEEYGLRDVPLYLNFFTKSFSDVYESRSLNIFPSSVACVDVFVKSRSLKLGEFGIIKLFY